MHRAGNATRYLNMLRMRGIMMPMRKNGTSIGHRAKQYHVQVA
jgi:hypothetical protein